jgi:thioredoxin 1
MAILTAAPADRAAVAGAFATPSRLVVVSLCAAWCDTCGEFRAGFERLAKAHPRATFVWLDIEDDAAIAGDIDVENFPTLAIYRGTHPLHFGISLPHEGAVGRLVDALEVDAATLREAPQAVIELPGKFLER